MLYFFSFLSCILFFTSDKKTDVIIAAIFAGFTAALFFFNRKSKKKNTTPSVLVFCIASLLSAFFSISLFHNLTGSRIIVRIASLMKMSDHSFLLIAVSIAAVISAFGLAFAGELIKGVVSNSKTRNTILIFSVSMLEYISLQYSTIGAFNLDTGFLLALVNVMLLYLFNVFLLLLVRRIRLALILSSALVSFWSVVNFYVIEFHGSPLFFSELDNFSTAMDVLKRGYSIHIKTAIIGLFLLLLVEILLTIRADNNVICWKQWGKCGAGFLAGILLFYFLIGYVPALKCTIEWAGKSAVNDYGFVRCLIEDTRSRIHPINQPDGYDSFSFENTIALDAEKDYPDIIFIMNESFCDLDYFTDIATDRDYLENFYNIENAAFGYAISPNIGGCTNNTEFEILTSNSMYLLNNSAPFNYIDFSKCGSTVKYFNELGYLTTGMHICWSNYRRGEKYPLIGFQESYLRDRMFHYHSFYGNREWTDADNYRDLEEIYQKNYGIPQFMFLVSYQNHGGYDLNPPELDTVHTTNNFGTLTEDVNEYLTTMSFSADAFAELTDYFSKINRRVIICMVGDHAPVIIKDLPAKEEMSAEETEVAKRIVPFVIWSNYEMDLPDNLGYNWMPGVLPKIMNLAEIPLSPYYEYILKLNEELPILLSTGYYIDKTGESGFYNKDSDYYYLLNRYYCMEYEMINGQNN